MSDGIKDTCADVFTLSYMSLSAYMCLRGRVSVDIDM
jgi:hypothetical protein